MKILFSCLFSVICCGAFAQSSEGMAGIWEGKLHTSVDLRIVFHIAKDSMGAWTATMDSPDQNVKGIKCNDVSMSNDSLSIMIPSIHGKYLGKIINGHSINGKWVQGLQLDLPLNKVDKPTTLNRPQTPVPPFPYAIEEVEYENAEKTIHYGATITTPRGVGPFPAVLLITGSGAQDRDETLFEHKPFAVIADYLSRRGVIVMRVDDRGMGKSTGSFPQSTSLDFARDVNTSVDYLRTRPEVDPNKLGLIGHSEGGMIAPMVASERKDIGFIILLAGPGVPIEQLMADQNTSILLSAGVNSSAVQAFRNFYPNIPASILNATDAKDASTRLGTAVNKWIRETPKSQVLATTGIYNDSTKKRFIQSTVGAMYSPWFLYFLKFDPTPWLEKLQCKVLALNGDKDVQVVAAPNLNGIQKALEKSKSKDFEVHSMPGLNHLFQTCKKCTVQEYGMLDETFSPVALQLMGQWIDSHVK